MLLRTFISRVVASALCVICCSPGTSADELQLLWQIGPGERDYLQTSNNERGVAYNPVTGHVLIVSRTTGLIHILDGETGAEIGTLNPGDGVIGGGTFPMSLIGVADDGAIYVGNLSTSTTAPNFRLYRWESEAAESPTVAFEGDPAGVNDQGASNNPQRWGDSMDVRGAGADTEILLGSNAASGATVAALLTTTNGTEFTAKLISNAATAGITGIAFGSGNTFWTKKSGQNLRRVTYDPATGVGTAQTIPTTTVPGSIVTVAVQASSNWLAGISVNTGPDDVRLYDISDPNAIFIADQESFPVDEANANLVGAADFGEDILVALDTNNGLVAYRVLRSTTPPSFATQPSGDNVLPGANFTLSASVSGTRPIDLRWQLNGADVPNATNVTLTVTNATAAHAGAYTLIAANATASVTSSVATVTVPASTVPNALTLLWTIAPGSRPYVTEGNTERGLAYNKATGRLLMVSRTAGVNIHVLDGETGEELWTLQTPTDVVSGSNPAGFRLNMIAVADDGAVYAANLDTPEGTTYAIYRWEDDSTNAVPSVAWAGAPVPGRRWGDTFAARGAGPNTQLIAASSVGTVQANNTVAIFTTADGVNFQAIPIITEGANSDAFRLGIAFGESDTFWGKVPGQPLRQVQFDLNAGTGTVLRTITNSPSSAAPVGTSSNLVAVIAFQSPDNIRLYDASGTTNDLPMVDGEFLPTDRANPNGTGAITFGGDKMFVLDTNNGIQAYRINLATTVGTAATLLDPQFAAGTFGFLLRGGPDTSYRVQGSSDLTTWTDVRTVLTGPTGEVQVTDTPAQTHRFYRAVAE